MLVYGAKDIPVAKTKKLRSDITTFIYTFLKLPHREKLNHEN